MNVVEALHSILIHSSFQPPWYYLLGKKKKSDKEEGSSVF